MSGLNICSFCKRAHYIYIDMPDFVMCGRCMYMPIGEIEGWAAGRDYLDLLWNQIEEKPDILGS